MQNWHHWNILNQDTQLNNFSGNIKYHIFGSLSFVKTSENSGVIISRFGVFDLVHVLWATDTSNKTYKKVDKSS